MNFDIQSLPARSTELGSLKILRALPRSKRRMVGAWCFLDCYGPVRFAADKPMDVAPHPHIGIQTVSWLLEGEIIHNDSLGCEALMRAGQLNLMTSGRGIAHAEETPPANSGILSGVQLWVALPRSHRDVAPSFDHHAVLPSFDVSGVTVKLIMGDLLGQSSPAKTFSPILGAEIAFHERSSLVLPFKDDFEHAIFVFDGDVLLNDQPLDNATLHYLAPGRDEAKLTGSAVSRLLLLGGRPFGEQIVMWWNFVAGTHDEIARAREDWIHHERFGEVKAYKGPRVPAPALLED
jgi:quercetin 2,3-dioxygenase